ncbi:hypothetical protein K469DRAFT_153660 [Zopfia rhizophila CBS 207.26]|uniref:HTH CENPB-type domain-containing protein n=1 Tax=Zopfia rhizophila CBS 207.26 TaxID=1314779 RepID=A0A6A6E2P8_9PEZI|nr:hypothetical protein K469DRAFT_153660 [Zopfia rhizophila CBS 207.26]
MRAHVPKETAYDTEVKRIKEAVQLLKTLNNPNVKQYARDHQLPYQRLLRAFHGGHNQKTRPQGNQKLTEEQDLALLRYCDAIDDISFGLHQTLVTQQANALLAEVHHSQGPLLTVGKQWVKRWLQSKLQYQRVKVKPIEVAQKLAQQPEGICA